MKIVTGVVHAGKTTLLVACGVSFVSWDVWLKSYLNTTEAKQSLCDVIPAEYLGESFFTLRFLALNSALLSQVCQRAAGAFRNAVQETQLAEVPLYALDAVRRNGDSVALVTTPPFDELVRRHMITRGCNQDKAKELVWNSMRQLDNIECDCELDTLDCGIIALSGPVA